MAAETESEVQGEREEAFSKWYIDTVLKAELADYTPVRGSMVIRPYGYAIWELIQGYVDRELKATGHQNAYFPLFIPLSFIQKEAEHVEGFAPQLAVVTHGGGEELTEPLVVRPTSETIIYDMLSKWIESYRDLPVLLNQWANVVRWEIRTRPFLRTAEFLWQEGHTAHATFEEADAEARLILDLYVRFIQDELAIPVYQGRKTESEKFAGGLITYTMEALMRDSKALQMGTSHNLGQNFSKAFDVTFLDRQGNRDYPWSTSWAVTTRLIGALIMVHGDSKGLRLPPRVAPIQVIIVPIWRTDDDREKVAPHVERVNALLAAAGIRVKVDWRDQVTPGFKFNDWELKGVPVRLEIGPRDVQSDSAVAVRRDTREKTPIPVAELTDRVPALLESVQASLYENAREFVRAHTSDAQTWEELRARLDDPGGFVRVNWCDTKECEAALAAEKATVRAIPLDETESTPTGPCVCCGQPAQFRCMVARAY
ncbi:MAG TPA: proline--tRNA ligase [Chloroflexota bacterium]